MSAQIIMDFDSVEPSSITSKELVTMSSMMAMRNSMQTMTFRFLHPRGILICGSGQGMCMAANRFNGIRALLAYDRESVRSARNDDDANVMCLPASVFEKDTANVLVETFLNTEFAAAPRFIRRIGELDKLNG